MVELPPITPSDFFSDAVAREAGFTDQFWYRAYILYLDELARDPSRSFAKYDIERTLRIPFQRGYVDVLVRAQPEPREERVLRFTAFPAGDEPGIRRVSRVYRYEETRPVLGEAALLDAGWRW